MRCFAEALAARAAAAFPGGRRCCCSPSTGSLHPELSRRSEVNRIEVTADDLRQLEVAWTAQWHRPPTPEEMRGLVEGRVREEILYREALALGLDQGDTIVKRRLAQKMEFLADDVSALRDPTADELQAWYAKNSERVSPSPAAGRSDTCTSPPIVAAPGRARTPCARSPSSPASRPIRRSLARSAIHSCFRIYYGDRSPEQIASTIRKRVRRCGRLRSEPGSWQGPIESGLGWHLVFVTSATPGRVPSYDEIEPEIKAGWIDEQRAEARQRAFEAMKAHYEIHLPEARVATVTHQPGT